jgi:hypothetical protein
VQAVGGCDCYGPNMRIAELVGRHREVYHLAADGAWPAIQKHGLWSTEAIARDLPPDQAAALRGHRPEIVEVDHPVLGRIVVRDQKLINMATLEKALPSLMSADDWLGILNRRVFFFPTDEAVERLRSSRAYKDGTHTVLIVDTESLLSAHRHRVELASINTGSATGGRTPGKRARDTFQPIERFGVERPAELRELSVLDRVTDIADHVIRVERRHGDGTREVLFER